MAVYAITYLSMLPVAVGVRMRVKGKKKRLKEGGGEKRNAKRECKEKR